MRKHPKGDRLLFWKKVTTFVFPTLLLVSLVILISNHPSVSGYAVRNIKGNLVDVSLTFTPYENSPGNSFLGTFTIQNKQNPLFEYTIDMKAPCGIDFFEINQWSSNVEYVDRIQFHGVIERGTRLGYYFVLPFLYEECLYRWGISSPNIKGQKQIPLLRPRESLDINFVLTATPQARPGVYTISFEDNYNLAGKSYVRFDRTNHVN